jgi:hypothetical protein
MDEMQAVPVGAFLRRAHLIDLPHISVSDINKPSENGQREGSSNLPAMPNLDYASPALPSAPGHRRPSLKDFFVWLQASENLSGQRRSTD